MTKSKTPEQLAELEELYKPMGALTKQNAQPNCVWQGREGYVVLVGSISTSIFNPGLVQGWESLC